MKSFTEPSSLNTVDLPFEKSEKDDEIMNGDLKEVRLLEMPTPSLFVEAAGRDRSSMGVRVGVGGEEEEGWRSEVRDG